MTSDTWIVPCDQEELTRQFYAEVEARITDPVIRERIGKVFLMALELHADQENYYDGSAYTTHVTRVALAVIQVFGVVDEDTICAALLHDAVRYQGSKLAPEGTAKQNVREAALSAIADSVGVNVAVILERVTFPDLEALANSAKEAGDSRSLDVIKDELYNKKLDDWFSGDPRTRVVKFAKFYEAGRVDSMLHEGHRPIGSCAPTAAYLSRCCMDADGS